MRILIFYRHFPVAMGRYIHWGLEQAGHEVISCGPYSKGTIPWGDFEYPEEYWGPPTIELPDTPEWPVKDVFKTMKDHGIPPVDLLIQAADTYFLVGKAPVKNVLIGTDPHVIDYYPHLEHVDHYVSMQKSYSKPGDLWMPYAHDPEIHQYLPGTPIQFDVVFCGLQYPHRIDALKQINDAGFSVFCGLGMIYDEYVLTYNRGLVAFNWSSKNDLPARFWEGLAMRRLVLTNRVGDLGEIDLKEDRDYLAFGDVNEAIDKLKIIINRPNLLGEIAKNGYVRSREHTYANRVKKLLKEIA